MIKLIMKPGGWPCTVDECEPGVFVAQKQLCFKSEYHRDGGEAEAFNSAGEAYHGDPDGLVTPVEPIWEDDS